MMYDSLRQFADSWGLLYLFLVFVFVVGYVFRPGSSRKARDAAHIPFDRD